MKIKTILVGFTLIMAITLLFVGVRIAVNKDSAVKNVINEMNGITKDAVQMLGEPLTIQKVQEAQKILDERKSGLVEKMADLKKSTDFSEKSEIANELNNCRAINKDKIAEIYNKYSNKSINDVKAINDLKNKLRFESSRKVIREINREIDEKMKALEANIDLLDAMDKFVSNYELVINTK